MEKGFKTKMELVYRRKSDIKGNGAQKEICFYLEKLIHVFYQVFSAFHIQIPIFFSFNIIMPMKSVIIGFKSIFGTILLWMTGCHVIAVLTAILRTVPFDVGQAVALEATKDCLFLGVRIWMEGWLGDGWYWLNRLGLNFIGVIKMLTKFRLSDAVEVVIDLPSEGVLTFL